MFSIAIVAPLHNVITIDNTFPVVRILYDAETGYSFVGTMHFVLFSTAGGT